MNVTKLQKKKIVDENQVVIVMRHQKKNEMKKVQNDYEDREKTVMIKHQKRNNDDQLEMKVNPLNHEKNHQIKKIKDRVRIIHQNKKNHRFDREELDEVKPQKIHQFDNDDVHQEMKHQLLINVEHVVMKIPMKKMRNLRMMKLLQIPANQKFTDHLLLIDLNGMVESERLRTI
jgi:hypothetical protein